MLSIFPKMFFNTVPILSLQSDQICYAVLCVFSYVAAGMDQTQKQQILEAAQKAGVASKS